MPVWNSVQLAQQTECLTLIQITDTHILPDPDADFDGINTGVSLKKVISGLKHDTHWPVDAVLVTGDLVHEPDVVAYERLKEQLNDLPVPVFCLAGNHDEPALMHDVLTADNILLPEIIDTRYWQLILLNSYLPGTHSGRIDEQDLARLDEALTRTGKSVLVCLHHPPVSVNSTWMDSMPLENRDSLMSVIDRHRHVKAMLWGHIHQTFVSERRGIQLLATPSTCVQFTPGSDRYIRDEKPPGYRWLLLGGDGSLETGVIRVD